MTRRKSRNRRRPAPTASSAAPTAIEAQSTSTSSTDDADDEEEALAALLLAANTRTYLDKLTELANGFGLDGPDELEDDDALAGLDDRARESAASIINTRNVILASIALALWPDKDAITARFNDWQAGQQELIARHETAMTASTAASDFISRNGLTGTAHVEPIDSAGLDDECDHAISQGEIPIEDIDIDLPAHPNCNHSWVYTLSGDAEITWIGN